MINNVCNVSCEYLETIQIGLISSCIALFVGWSTGFFKFPYLEPSEKVTISIWEVLLVFGLFLGVNLMLNPILSFLVLSFQKGEWITEINLATLDSHTHGWLNAMSIAMSTICILSLIAKFSSGSKYAIWRARAFGSVQQQFADYLIGASTWLVAYPLMILAAHVISYTIYLGWDYTSNLDQVAVRYVTMIASYPFLLAVTILLIVFLVPIVEELLFRGFVQTWLKEKYGTFPAIILTSLGFSAFHFSSSQGIENIELIVSLCVLSFFLGFVYERQQSLWASIGLHSTFNAISIFGILLT